MMSPALIGGLVVGISLAAAAIFCTGLCLALWYRRLRGQAGDPSPATFLVSKRKPDQYAAPDHPMAFVMPTITASDAGSEPPTPTPTQILTPTERSKAIARSGGCSTSSTLSQARSNLPNPEDHPNVQRWDALASSSRTPPPAYSPPSVCKSSRFCTSPPSYTPLYSNARPRSASPKGLLKNPQPNPPLSLPLAGNRWTPRAAKRPRSASPKVLHPSPASPPALPPRSSQGLASRTPPVLPPRSIFLRRTSGGTEEVRAALQGPHGPFDDEGRRSRSPDLADVTTPDSVDGWGPSWTLASSVASGGGCGLGELQVRLRYYVRTRLLRLTILSADNLPSRLGPEPVETYTKAVLLPDKRVRFSTRTVPALRNAHFNASFTHAARPSRLAHATLRFSVCQVTSCGRRLVLGYAALPLASMGLRGGLSHDLDTGSLTLPLQESAPDQQVGMGGQLQIGLSWDSDAHELNINILHLMGLQYDQNAIAQEVQVYIKVTVYTNNTILCWIRTTPRPVEGEITLFEEELVLRMPELDLDATHLVLSARERTGPGCGRRVLGSCVVGRGSCVGEDGRHHWLDMLRAAPDIVVRTHPLAALAPFQNMGQPNPPTYQNVFVTSSQNQDMPTYHRYQNIGLISSQSFPPVEIPGPENIQSKAETQQEHSQEPEEPSSSDECQSSELLSPDQCQSSDHTLDESHDTELSSLNDSHHSEVISSDQSHYSEISSPVDFQQEDSSAGAQSFAESQSAQKDSDVADSNNSPVDEARDPDQARENTYYNQPPTQSLKNDMPKIPVEPIYAKPNLTLKRNRKTSSGTFSTSSIMTNRSSYRSSFESSEHIYDSPDLTAHRIYEKPGMPPLHVYENSNLYQAPDLTISHIYQNPNISPTHIYESPDNSPEHIYQMPYESSLRRYQNIDVLIQALQTDYQNVGGPYRQSQKENKYENIPVEQGRPVDPSQAAIDHSSPKADRHSVPGQCQDSNDREQEECSSEQKEHHDEQDASGSCHDNVSDTSEVFHDARSSTYSSND